jgi:hypothetical protein
MKLHVTKTYGSTYILVLGTKCMWSASVSGRFTPSERALSTDCIERCVCPIASLESVEGRKIFLSCQEWNSDSSAVQVLARLHLARISSLWSKGYRFRCLSFFFKVVNANTTIFSSMISCRLVDRYFVFGRMCGLYLKGRL